jgi:alkanesulfonate monooxygenase SsuD/methylene tetrahydromethanopterin reductase-like flavin-dependent oxidoreductase (luciferase family)
MEVGLQLHLPTYHDYSLPHLVELAKRAHAGGVTQLWITDNLQSRNVFVVLAAIGASVPMSLGTAVLVQYFRSPVDVADAVAPISELMEGPELSIGIARGNPRTPQLVDTVKPITMLAETAACLRRLLAGERVEIGDYPTVATYFNFAPQAAFQMNVQSQARVRLYCGGNAPLSLEVGGRLMDGLVFGGSFQTAARSGHMGPLLDIFRDAAAKAGKTALPQVAEIKLSVSQDGQAAREEVRARAGRRLLGTSRLGYTRDEIERLGFSPEDVERLEQAAARQVPNDEFKSLVTDAMIDAVYVAGDPMYCKEKMIEVARPAEESGFHQLMFSELGPDPEEGLKLLCDEIIPALPVTL